jgi:transcription initiation factor IIE alpha subunit
MLPDAKVSLAAMPERLIARSQKFYDLTPDKTITALRKAQEVKKVNIEEIVEWLEYLWLTEEDLREDMTEAEWLEFIEAVKSADE